MRKIILILICLIIPISIHSLEYPKLNSKTVEIYDLNDNKILYEIGGAEKTSIASLTKIATTITAIENIDNIDEQVTITQAILNTVSKDASVANLKPGDKLTYKDLLYASMLPSGADATNSIAILSSGSIENFVNKMNELIKTIGLTNTNFINVTGLDAENHYSTADDVRKLLQYSLKNPIFKEIYTTKQYKMTNGSTVKSTLYKYNASNSALEKILGSKSGFTENAGYCLASLSNVNGHEIITIVLNAENKNEKYYNVEDTITLIDFMNQNYKNETLIENHTLIKTIPVTLSKIEEYQIYSDKKIEKYLPSDYDINNLKIEYEGLTELNFRNYKEEKIGTIKYYYEDELLYEQNVILDKKIDLDLIKLLKKHYIIIITIVSIIFIYLIKPKRKK